MQWDDFTMFRRKAYCKYAGLPGITASKSWENIRGADRVKIVEQIEKFPPNPEGYAICEVCGIENSLKKLEVNYDRKDCLFCGHTIGSQPSQEELDRWKNNFSLRDRLLGDLSLEELQTLNNNQNTEGGNLKMATKKQPTKKQGVKTVTKRACELLMMVNKKKWTMEEVQAELKKEYGEIGSLENINYLNIYRCDLNAGRMTVDGEGPKELIKRFYLDPVTNKKTEERPKKTQEKKTPEKKTPTKTAAKKTPAKETAPKKTAAKKTPAKKTPPKKKA